MQTYSKILFFALIFVFISSYAAASVCGNGVCETDETASNCSADCGSTEVTCSTTLPAPTNLRSTTITSNSIALAWNMPNWTPAPPNVTYSIQRSLSPAFSGPGTSTVYATNELSKTITGLQVNTPYYFKIAASDGVGCRASEQSDSITISTLAATTATGTLDVFVREYHAGGALITGATVSVYEYENPNAIQTKITDTYGITGKVSFTLPTPASGKSYYPKASMANYALWAGSEAGLAVHPNETERVDISLIPIPSAIDSTVVLTGISEDDADVALSWTASSTSGVTYHVYKNKISDNFYTRITDVPLSSLSETDNDAENGVTYKYFVTTVLNNMNQKSSNSITVTPGIPPAILSAPTTLTATVISSSRVDLVWSDVENATGYTVQRLSNCFGAGNYATLVSNVDIISYADTTVEAGTNYCYRVMAQNASGNSANTYSSRVTIPQIIQNITIELSPEESIALDNGYTVSFDSIQTPWQCESGFFYCSLNQTTINDVLAVNVTISETGSSTGNTLTLKYGEQRVTDDGSVAVTFSSHEGAQCDGLICDPNSGLFEIALMISTANANQVNFNETETISGLKGAGTLNDQDVTVKFLALLQTAPDSDYIGMFELYDAEGNLVDTRFAPANSDLRKEFANNQGFVLKSIVNINSYSFDTETGIAAVSVTLGGEQDPEGTPPASNIAIEYYDDGESISQLRGSGSVEGQDVTVKFLGSVKGEFYYGSSTNEYRAYLELYDSSSNLVDGIITNADTDLWNSFIDNEGQYALLNHIDVINVYFQTSAGKSLLVIKRRPSNPHSPNPDPISKKMIFNEQEILSDLDGAGLFAGTKVSVHVDRVIEPEENPLGGYSATFSLLASDSSLIDTRTVRAGEFLSEIFLDNADNEALATTVSVPSIFMHASLGTHYVELKNALPGSSGLSENLLLNPSFESPVVPGEWQIFNGSRAVTGSRTNNEFADGQWSFLVSNDNAQNGNYYALYQSVKIKPGTYIYGGKMKSDLTSGVCHIDLYNSDGIKENINEGEEILGLYGAKDYAGKYVRLKLMQILQINPLNGGYEATFELYSDENPNVLIDTQTVSAGTNLNEEFAELATDVYVSGIGVVATTGIGYIEFYKRPSNDLYPFTVDTSDLVLRETSAEWQDFSATFIVNQGTDLKHLDFRILGDGQRNLNGSCYFDELFLKEFVEPPVEIENTPPKATLKVVQTKPARAPIDVTYTVECTDDEDDLDSTNYAGQFCRIEFGALVEVTGGNLLHPEATMSRPRERITFPWNTKHEKWVSVKYHAPGIYSAAGVARDKDGATGKNEETIIVPGPSAYDLGVYGLTVKEKSHSIGFDYNSNFFALGNLETIPDFNHSVTLTDPNGRITGPGVGRYSTLFGTLIPVRGGYGFTTVVEGIYTLSVDVDSGKEVTETNENNNFEEVKFHYNGAIVVPVCELQGDVDGDGEITCEDVDAILEYAALVTKDVPMCGDVNYDGIVGTLDASALMAEHNLQCGEEPEPTVCTDTDGRERVPGETWTTSTDSCTCTANSTVECENLPQGTDSLKPKVNYNWNWQEIGSDFCDGTGNQYCDATQFSVYLLRNIYAISNHTFVANENKSILQGGMLEFDVLLMRDGYSNDFRKDFDYYYRTQTFFEVDDWYAQVGNGHGLRSYFYDPTNAETLNLWQFQLNSQPWADGMTIGHGTVKVKLTFPDDFSLTEAGTNPIIVDFISTTPPTQPSNFYSLPFNGAVGLSSAAGETIDRIGYGVGYNGSEEILLPLNSFGNSQTIFSETLESNDGVAKLRNVVIKNSLSELNEFAKSGEMIRITKVSDSEFDLEFSPSTPTPILLRANRKATDPANFKVQYFASSAENPVELENDNFISWTSNTNACLDFEGTIMNSENYSGFLDDKVSNPEAGFENALFEVAWQNSTKTGNVVLQSIVYRPLNVSNLSMRLFKDVDASFYTPNDSGIIVALEGTGTTVVDSAPQTLAGALSLFGNGYASATESADSSIVKWNETQLDSIINGQRNNLRATCIAAAPTTPEPGDDEPDDEPDVPDTPDVPPGDPNGSSGGFLGGLLNFLGNLIGGILNFILDGILRNLIGAFTGAVNHGTPTQPVLIAPTCELGIGHPAQQNYVWAYSAPSTGPRDIEPRSPQRIPVAGNCENCEVVCTTKTIFRSPGDRSQTEVTGWYAENCPLASGVTQGLIVEANC